MAYYVMGQLTEHAEVRRGTLGIFDQDLKADQAGDYGLEQGAGALVTEVDGGSPADKEGLQAGDVVTAVGGNPVKSAQDFHNLEGQFPVDDKVRVDYVREGKEKSARLKVAELDKLAAGELDHRLEGAVFEDIPIKQRSSQVRGVILVELESDSRLARRGMRPGDIVIGANRNRIGSLEEFREVVGGINGTLYLEVLRKGRDYVVRVD